MKPAVAAICALLMLSSGYAPAAPIHFGDQQPKWLIGYWHLYYDEDGDPPDWGEFMKNGEFREISPKCHVATGHYHLYGGDVYVTFLIPGKGPVAIVYRPSPDKKRLVYTSIRTRHNATYKKTRSIPCMLGRRH